MSNFKYTEEERKANKKEKKSKRSRFLKNNYPIFKNGFFNIEDRAPLGFNYALGYCETPNCTCL